MILMVTGHRPERIGKDPERIAWLKENLRSVLAGVKEKQPALRVICGMARGSDLWFGEAALDLGIPLVAAVPFEGQSDDWNDEDRALYERVKAGATVRLLYPKPPRDYGQAVVLLRSRNEWMVKQADRALAVWDGGSGGGTYQTVKLLRVKQTPTLVLDPGKRECRRLI